MIQGGDPTGTGMGGPGYTIKDDNINSWKHLFGKRIESTNMGGIKEALKHKASTFILLDRFCQQPGNAPNAIINTI